MQKVRFIPIIIEQCDVPVALQSTAYERIENAASYDNEFHGIVAAIFGVSDKPEPGKVPDYARVELAPIPTLTRVDNIVLKLACDVTFPDGDFFVSASDIVKLTDPMGMPQEEVYDAIRVLHEGRLVEGPIEGRPHIEHFKITLRGFHEYAKAYIANLDDVLTAVAARIVNDGMTKSKAIQHATGQPAIIIEYVLNSFTNQGWIESSGAIGGDIYIADVSPRLKRHLLQ